MNMVSAFLQFDQILRDIVTFKIERLMFTIIISFIRHLQRFWGASGDFWQAQWDKILDKLGDDPVTLWVHGISR